MNYSEILKQYAVKTDSDFGGRNKKREKRLEDIFSKEEYADALNDFCAPEDLIGITASVGCIIFNRYLKEHGMPPTGRNIFSRMVKDIFGMRSQFIQTDSGRCAVVFVIDDGDNPELMGG